MTRFDTIITGGRISTASDTFQCDIGIREGRIAALGHDLGIADETIDATGKWVLPGGIDSHVHISQPSGEGVVMADDFESATRSAALGGNTMVLPFCLQESGVPLRESLKDYHAKAEGSCHTDVSFHLIISDPTEQVLGQDLPALVHEGYTSFKVFMTYEGLALSDLELLKVMAVARETRALVMVHAENYDVIRYLTDQLEQAGRTAPFFHATSRPVIAEREATYRAISLAELSEVPLMVVHVSNREAMEEIRRARQKGLRIFGETCPQYLTLTEGDLEGLNMEGAKYVCSPPPRDHESQQACWEGLQQGVFDVFSSDHCPFRYDDPQGKLTPKGRTSFRWVPNGIPGVGARLPILFSEGVVKGRIDINRFVALTATNHARTYGLYPKKGTIAVGADADIAIWDPGAKNRLTHAMLNDGADYTPYEGMELTGWPVLTMLRGQTIMRDGVLTGIRAGAHVARRISDHA
ncbi:dihydropyrimidinase [Paracoccus denitrificans]|jgi:dihydropyrimidinase|uniref:Dihydropyrimidinase n=1 Tax=Paracoccus denitrificans (strain Pd 1222) TaxID=318586 RepID=A1BAY5_PARDP|nr:dihydropyrimidinase [Paracoccus denitrificans]ABL72679.1 dihydropyrimidinase [Paracoccus denitrificans PD1222]MBB4629302.1 dihydropyrimidinase [Paracoccus denitrificans]MCU7430321.1 dihydropyrimidinase [Paracoccus denitrificans]QAR29654.1 dihydropyrimidinase [Paracoccus denitrificans]UPV98574.1 dihydropyrimidinase [Paracoccus denitrificans]